MKRTILNGTAGLLLLLLAGTLSEARAGYRTHFLFHGAGVAACGRGETAAAYPDGFGSVFYNPALLASSLRGRGAACVSHVLLYEGSRYSFAGAGTPLGKKSALSVSASNLRSGDIELRRGIADSPVIDHANHWAFFLTGATVLEQAGGVRLGLTAKHIALDMGGYRGGGWGADAGIGRRFKSPRAFGDRSTIDAGLSVQNLVQPSVRLVSERETYGRVYRAGAALSLPTAFHALSCDRLIVCADAALSEGNVMLFGGAEYALRETFIFRAGAYGGHFTAGAGYAGPAYALDYAVDLAEYALFHRIGLSIPWGNSGKKRTRKSSRENERFMQEVDRAAREARAQERERSRDIARLFSAAKDSYDRGHFLRAADRFREILLSYPECDGARTYLERIETTMRQTAVNPGTVDFERLCYASGYIAYRGQDIPAALNEWEKVLSVNPRQGELAEYREACRAYIRDAERRAREAEAEEAVRALFEEGVRAFERREWIPSIRTMEQVRETCAAGHFPSALSWRDRAQEYIRKAVDELSRGVVRKPKGRKKTEEKPAEQHVDPAGAERKYNEGLIMFSRGKLAEAARLWEIAVRLNPEHEKAWKALERVKDELKAAAGEK